MIDNSNLKQLEEEESKEGPILSIDEIKDEPKEVEIEESFDEEDEDDMEDFEPDFDDDMEDEEFVGGEE